MDLPAKSNNISLDYLMDEINKASDQLEQFMQISITESQILKEIKFSNKIKKEYLRLITNWANNGNSISPQSFIYLLSMIHFGFTDQLSDSKMFLENLIDINENLEKMKKNSEENNNGPKIMLAPMFGGFEPQIMNIVSEVNGRLLFIDWETLGLLEQIEESGNIIENFARYLLNFSSIFMNNSTLTKKWIEITQKYSLDAVIFNSVYGCKSLTPASRMLKEELLEINVPMLDLSFQNLDENIGQLKTRVQAFIEMINK